MTCALAEAAVGSVESQAESAGQSRQAHADLIERVKAIQKASAWGKLQWRGFCEDHNAELHDPKRHSAAFLVQFLEEQQAGGVRVAEDVPVQKKPKQVQQQPPRAPPPPKELDAARSRISAASGQEVWDRLPSPWQPLYASPHKFRYDPACFDFVSVVREMLDCPEGLPLSRLHEVQRAPEYQPCPPLRKGMQLAGIPLAPEKKVHKSRNKNKRDWTTSPAYQGFVDLYWRFIEQQVLPEYCRVQLPAPSAEEGARADRSDSASAREEALEEFVVQSTPVLRVVMPSPHFSTQAHRDADYGHLPEELNFWVPLSPVGDSSSLFAESFPGRGDFEAFRGDAGDAFRFWGNQCAHYAEPNVTGSTRVSFDFRVVPRRFWDASEAAGCVREAAARRTIFHEGELAIGYYYKEVRV